MEISSKFNFLEKFHKFPLFPSNIMSFTHALNSTAVISSPPVQLLSRHEEIRPIC